MLSRRLTPHPVAPALRWSLVAVLLTALLVLWCGRPAVRNALNHLPFNQALLQQANTGAQAGMSAPVAGAEQWASWLASRRPATDLSRAAQLQAALPMATRPFTAYWLAESKAAQGNYAVAIELYRSVGAGLALLQLGDALGDGVQLPQQAAAYAASAAVWPQPVTWLRWGDALVKLERYAEAEVVYRTGLAHAPNNYGFYVGLGNIDRAQGLYASAQIWYDEAVRRTGAQEWPYFASGWAYEMEGDLAAAEGRYRAVLELNPDNCQALGRLGIIQTQRGDWDEAAQLLERGAAVCPTAPWLWQALGDVRWLQEAWAAAADAYAQTIALQPENSYAQTRLEAARTAGSAQSADE